ncbi:P-loop containing nucleoside triphosphate hydrolase protein [Rhypophila decipiens]
MQPTFQVPGSQRHRSSKVRALVDEVKAALPGKSVIFSSWKQSLNEVENALQAESICCVRFDGSLSSSERDVNLARFHSDDSIKAMLMTVICGGVGIDLTAASRIHILEPHWNPATEEQAIARVHRFGQQRDVVTLRYVVSNSIEESVALVKERKEDLADLLLGDSQREEPKKLTTSLVVPICTPSPLSDVAMGDYTSGYGN